MNLLLNRAARVTDELLLARLRSSGIGQQIEDELEQQRLAERAEQVAEIARLQSGLEAQLPALASNLEKAREALRKAREAVTAAVAAYLRAEGADRSARYQAESQIAPVARHAAGQRVPGDR